MSLREARARRVIRDLDSRYVVPANLDPIRVLLVRQEPNNDDDLTFGECEGLCGRMVERIGWDSFCFSCQEEMREEDEAREEARFSEDVWLYGI